MGRAIPFSEDELVKIESLLKENTPVKKIAVLLDRSQKGVSNKISQFGGVLKFTAKDAIDHRNSIRKKTVQQAKELFTPAKYKALLGRVDSLEMQVQILTQVIKTHVKNTNNN